MPLSVATLFLCLFLIGVGLISVHMEVRNVQSGVRVRTLLEAEESAVDRLRRLELAHHEQLSPDVLEAGLGEEFLTPEGFPDDGRRIFRVEPEVPLEGLGGEAAASESTR